MLNFQELKREVNTVTGTWPFPRGNIPNASQLPLRYPEHTFVLSPLSLLRDHPLPAVHRTDHLRRAVLVALRVLVRLDHLGVAVRGECHG